MKQMKNQIKVLDEGKENCTNCYYFVSAVSSGGHCWKHKSYLSFPETTCCNDFIKKKEKKKERKVEPLFCFKSFVLLDM